MLPAAQRRAVEEAAPRHDLRRDLQAGPGRRDPPGRDWCAASTGSGSTGDTTRARGIGIDKAARTGITAAEAVLGGRLPFFADTVRY